MNRWFCLMGPTAVGKTGLACELIAHFPFEIISIDSAMIYREMDIGSAKPDPALLAQAPHHLIDILDPNEIYSAAQCCTDVLRCAEDIESRGKIPLLVGGTMLYFRAVQQGLSALPAADLDIRARLSSEAELYGWEYMHGQLAKVDAETAKRIHPNDTQRILRALEVYRITQKPLSIWLQTNQQTIKRSFVNIILMPKERSWLHQRIAQRFKDMISGGFIEEVHNIVQKYALNASHPAMRCVGYRQVWDYLQDHQDKMLLCERGIAATRQLAKRQMTWLRHWSEGEVIPADEKINLREMIAFIQRITDN